MPYILIKNGTVINATETFVADVLIKNKHIALIGNNIPKPLSAQLIDARGKYIIPGGIDPHVHLDLPTPAGNSSDDFYTGSVAAFSGGTTCFIDFVTPSKGESLIEALHKRKAVAENSLADYSLHLGITWWHSSLAFEIKQCIEKEGITSFKTYLAYKGSIGISYKELFEIMKVVAKFNGIVTVHCEDGDSVLEMQQQLINDGKTSPRYHAQSRPAMVEAEAVEKVLQMAKQSKCKTYLVHISSALSMQKILQYNLPNVMVETCPHYLLLNEEVYDNDRFETAKYVISPPLRSIADNDELWKRLADNSIKTVGTDHCPFNLAGQKEAGKADFTKIPNGAGSIEYRLSLLYTYGVLTGKITLQQWVALTSANAAEIFGLSTTKGKIASCFDADLVIWNPEPETTISTKNQYQRCDSTIYEGFKLKGIAETVISKGQIVFDKGVFFTKGMKGDFISRKI
jgi:dihydropyrimidinase